MRRTVFSLIIGVGVISLLLFAINVWLRDEEKGILLTQDSYMGTITWYEDDSTPPIPSEFMRENGLLAKNGAVDRDVRAIPNQEIVKEFENMDLTTNTAAGPEITGSVTNENSTNESPIKELPKPIENIQQEKIAGIVEEKKVASAKVQEKKAVKPQVVGESKKVAQTSPSKKILEEIFLTKQKDFPILIKTNSSLAYTSFYLASPDRLVVDLVGKFIIDSEDALLLPKNPYVKSVRVAYNGDNTRIVFDLLTKPKNWATKYLRNKTAIGVSL
ncbi:MAG: AMIN domain-containing protein [Desulfovibrionaceae bacterium]